MPPYCKSGFAAPRRTLGYTLSIFASLAIFLSGALKFIPLASALEPLEKLGLEAYALEVGLAEVALAILYWLPRTQRLGFFLLCTYIGAILLGEILMDEFPLPALILGTMIYLGTYLRMPTLFSTPTINTNSDPSGKNEY